MNFRLIVVVDGERTIQEIVHFQRAPHAGDVISLAAGGRVTVRHVLEAQRHGLSGIVLAWTT